MFTNEQIDQMRREVENPALMKERIEREKQQDKIIAIVKRMFQEQGRDFDTEFRAWQEKQGGR